MTPPPEMEKKKLCFSKVESNERESNFPFSVFVEIYNYPLVMEALPF